MRMRPTQSAWSPGARTAFATAANSTPPQWEPSAPSLPANRTRWSLRATSGSPIDASTRPAELLSATAESVAGRRVGRTLALPPVIEDVRTARLVSAIFDAEASGATRLSRETRLLALLARLATRHAREPVAPRNPTLSAVGITRARDYLVAHLSENVALGKLASLAGLDSFAFLRGFSRAYGLPPHAWLVQERVRRAQALLRAGLLPAEVAAEVGFSDQSHLTRHFKRILGFTPGSYRHASLARRGN